VLVRNRKERLMQMDTTPEQIHQLWTQHFNTGDLDALVDLFEDQATLILESGQRATGKEAIRAAISAFLAVGSIEGTTRSVIQSGDIALLSANFCMHGTSPDGKPIEINGTTTEVVRRQADGRWQFVIDYPFSTT
jgi:uncharacterized protein (TIGR02246 family)